MRDISDFGGVVREAGWILVCIAAATAFCYVAPEYGYTPVPFFSIAFYVLSGVVRLLTRAWRRRHAQ